MLNRGKVMKGSGGRRTDLTLGNRNSSNQGVPTWRVVSSLSLEAFRERFSNMIACLGTGVGSYPW